MRDGKAAMYLGSIWDFHFVPVGWDYVLSMAGRRIKTAFA
jgi:hypothetical protein